MTKNSIMEIVGGRGHIIDYLKTLLPVLAVLALAAGCQTPPSPPPAVPQNTNITEVIILREGDMLKISFPANANLNTTQPIRRDGMISMPLVGEVKAAGRTPEQLEGGSGEPLLDAVIVEGGHG
jgi:protein involved in polysaccharide export with SLBB domain